MNLTLNSPGLEQSNSLLVAVDTGNKQIKTQHRIFTAGIVDHDRYPPFGKDVIQYNGKFYTLSDKRIPYMRDKTEDERYFILTLFGIAYEARQAQMELEGPLNVSLLVGLPPAHFGAQQDKYREYFGANTMVDFAFNEQPLSIFVSEVVVYPQAFAAVALNISELKAYPKAIVIDIGGYTADLLKLNCGAPDLSICDSLEYGTINFYNQAIERVNSTYDTLLEEGDVDYVLRGETTVLPDKIIKLITELAGSYVEDFFNRLREKGIDLKTYHTVFAGGGSILFRPFIEMCDKLGPYQFVEEIKSNALGYERLYQLGL